MFFIFLGIEYVNSVCNLVAIDPALWVDDDESSYPLLTRYLLLTSSCPSIRNFSVPIWTTSSTLNFLEIVESEKVTNVVIPVVESFAMFVDNPELTVVTPIVFIPSMFL